MASLPVNIRSVEWAAVVEYAGRRREELLVDAVNLRSERERRDEACARLAELEELLAAPHRTLTEAQHRAERSERDAAEGGRGVY